ncbi:MAG: DUF3048 domain-containing protein, partial [Actinomycetes bacterium]
MTSTTLSRLVVGVLSATLVVSACSDDPEPQRAKPKPTPTTSSPTPTPTPTPKPPALSLLSGRKLPDRRIYAVKIDNTAKSHPQMGVDHADVVWVEQVEGGATRLAAIYSTRYTRLVGPVRSARITDIELLRQYGAVGLIYSGSQRKLSDNLRRSPLKLMSNDASGRGFFRSGRPAPYNVIGQFPALRKRGGKVAKPTKAGYEFGAAPKGGRRASHVIVRYPFNRIDAHWYGKERRWLLSMDGAPDRGVDGRRLGPTTFVVQFTQIKRSAYHDVNGANTPRTVTVGKGKALFFRDHRVYPGTWKRARQAHTTSYTIRGKKAVFAPGQV